MDRLACIDLPAFPLQLLLRREQAWEGRPVAVVEEDKPLARILWLNERAREFGILPGMRYAAGLALCGELCAGVVSRRDIEKGVALIGDRLRTFGPGVEPSPDEPGLFWLGAGGLERLNPSLQLWAGRIHASLEEAGFSCGVVVGFERFPTCALARALRRPRAWVLASREEERTWTRRVPLDRIGIEPAVLDNLDALGVKTVGDLLELPPVGLRERYGEEVHKLHLAARGGERLPVQPEEAVEPLREELILDDGERDASRLLFLVKRMLDPLLKRLAEKRLALAALALELKPERGPRRTERLHPAAATLDARQLLDLVRLRLEALQHQSGGLGSGGLGSGVIELAIEAHGTKATERQLELFAEQPRRDPGAQERAFARLRAELGEDAVVHAVLREGHLPEASFRWEPLRALPPAKPRLCRRTLIRRLRAHPWALPHRPRHEEDGWQLRGRDDSSVEAMLGPYVVSGGWWRAELLREYYFARTRKGECLWVFRDRNRRRWYLQGRVE